ncbi:MAG: septation protein A [Gammaproteobacteria bacterium RIFCSPHIGHO2_12_FULL_41_15]|nr:MAG: septation protein A [Gammaproteobacteria bacterium RIFCSPHIGHO2_12_FULL_41_15]
MGKIFFDYLPIFCFFVAYFIWGIFVATAVTMAASFVQNIIYRIRHGQFEKTQLITFFILLFMGGATLFFHNEAFIKWKVTVVYWLFAAILLVSHWSDKPVMQRLLGEKLTLPVLVWRKLNISWGLFFLFLGAINIVIIRYMSTEGWVYFKFLGTLGLTVLFVIAQAFFLSKYIDEKQLKGKDKK